MKDWVRVGIPIWAALSPLGLWYGHSKDLSWTWTALAMAIAPFLLAAGMALGVLGNFVFFAVMVEISKHSRGPDQEETEAIEAGKLSRYHHLFTAGKYALVLVAIFGIVGIAARLL